MSCTVLYKCVCFDAPDAATHGRPVEKARVLAAGGRITTAEQFGVPRVWLPDLSAPVCMRGEPCVGFLPPAPPCLVVLLPCVVDQCAWLTCAEWTTWGEVRCLS